MGKAEDAVNIALQLAKDDSHGYSQSNRWGPDYDCSSFVIECYQRAGVPVKTNGASYTGNMLSAFLKSGFKLIDPSVDGLKPGDVLLNVQHHAALYIGDNQIVQATISENGTVYGQSGDQTGKEIAIYSYYNYPWDYYFRLMAEPEPEMPTDPNEFINYGSNIWNEVEMPLLKMGMYGPAVCAMQGALRYHGFLKKEMVTGGFGIDTFYAVENFQKRHKLEIDGVCGPKTWNELMNWR